jgi:hypothetical protein
MTSHLAGAAVVALGMLISAPAAAADVAADKKVACRTETQKMAHILIRTRGKGATPPALEKSKQKVGEEVWNAMSQAYADDPRAGERDLAQFGYEYCVAGAATGTK